MQSAGGNSVIVQAPMWAQIAGMPRSCTQSANEGIRSTTANAASERPAIPSSARPNPSAARCLSVANREAIAAPIAIPARKLASMVENARSPLPTTCPIRRTQRTS